MQPNQVISSSDKATGKGATTVLKLGGPSAEGAEWGWAMP